MSEQEKINQEKIVRAIATIVQKTYIGEIQWKVDDVGRPKQESSTQVIECYSAKFSQEISFLLYSKSFYKVNPALFPSVKLPDIFSTTILEFRNKENKTEVTLSSSEFIAVDELLQAVRRQLAPTHPSKENLFDSILESNK